MWFRSPSTTKWCRRRSRRGGGGGARGGPPAGGRVGRAMLAAIGEFEQRPYSGSRIILLVSDGGTHLDDPTRRRIRAGMLRHRIALYWIYIRSFNSPSLDAQDRASEAVPEIALHRFFQTLATPYQAYQAEVPGIGRI